MNYSNKKYKVEENKTGLTIIKYLGNSKNVKIPNKIQGINVTSIGSYAFRDNKLTGVVLPEGLTSIGSCAFSCNKLTSVVFPEGLTSIGSYAFRDNKLTGVVLPEGLTSIGSCAFSCNKLTSVVFPEGLTSIGSCVFSCNKLTSVVFPESLTSIGSYAFRDNKLTSVVLPEGLTSIGSCAFRDNKLTNVMLKGKELNVKNIDNHLMIVDNEKTKGEYTILKCRYLDYNLKPCYVVQKYKYYAHGNTIKEAIEDVNFKYLQATVDLSDLVNKIKENNSVSISQYRLLTGACREGVKNFLNSNNIKEDKLPLKEVIEITKGHYGSKKLTELLG